MGIFPAALGSKDQQPAAFSPKTQLFYVPTNHVCMDYEPFRVTYTPGQPYVGATLSMYPAPGSHGGMGNFVELLNICLLKCLKGNVEIFFHLFSVESLKISNKILNSVS